MASRAGSEWRTLPGRVLVDAITGAVRAWPKADRVRWRALLNAAPREAILLGELALWLEAVPVEEPEDEQLELETAA